MLRRSLLVLIGLTIVGCASPNATLGGEEHGKTPLSFGRTFNPAYGFSPAQNLASQTSKHTGIVGANQLLDAIQQSSGPMDLLHMATMNAALAPHGEIQFSHDRYGFGGDRDDPMSPEYLKAALGTQTGNPNAIFDWISGINISTGEGGVTRPNYLLTDWYRRKFVSSLSPDLQRQVLAIGDPFQPMPEDYSPENYRKTLMGYAKIAQMSGQQTPFGSIEYAGLRLCPLLRDLSELNAIRSEIEQRRYSGDLMNAPIPNNPQGL